MARAPVESVAWRPRTGIPSERSRSAAGLEVLTFVGPCRLRPALGPEGRLLGSILGQVLAEAEGPERLADVERLRHATIELRQTRGPRAEELLAGVVAMVDGFDLGRAESVARAFTVYFQLVNLAEERHRVRTLRARSQAQASVPESRAVTVAGLPGAQGV